jgi:hypothetical protein
MFYEIDSSLLRQDIPNLTKRWFRDYDTEQDLIIWQGSANEIEKFQLWYRGYVLDWDKSRGLRTGKRDAGTGGIHHYSAEIFNFYRENQQNILDYVTEVINNLECKDSNLNSMLKNVLNEITQVEDETT